MKKYEVKLNKKDIENSGVFAISIVDKPAIQSNFITLSEDEKLQTINLSEDDEMIVTGASLIPNKMIYRSDINGEEGYLYFSKDTIKEIVELYFKNGNSQNFTIEHKDKTYDVSLFESWIKNSEIDKSVGLGIDVPDGSWLTSLKIHDVELWSEIKQGNLNGLSVEANILTQLKSYFKEDVKPVKLTKEEIVELFTEELLKYTE